MNSCAKPTAATRRKRLEVTINFADWWKGQNQLLDFLSDRFDLKVSDNPDFLFYSVFGKEFLKYGCIRIFFSAENVRPDFDECDYAFSYDYLSNDRHYRLPWFRLCNSYNAIKRPKNVDRIIPEKVKFCNFVFSNDVAIRNRFFELLSAYKKVDAPGRCMTNMPPIGPYKTAGDSRNAAYWEEAKIEFLRPYKFTIAFENMNHVGYTTEKLIDAMAAHTIPVYFGDPLAIKDFNPKSFINCHDYSSFDRVIEKIIELDNNHRLYHQMLSEPWFRNDCEPAYLNRNHILDCFESIFMNKKVYINKSNDLFKWYKHRINGYYSTVALKLSSLIRTSLLKQDPL
jgi:alpha(1,3/1,4) fucosyltransferase